MARISDYVTPFTTAMVILVLSSTVMLAYGFYPSVSSSRGTSKPRAATGSANDNGMPQLPKDVVKYSQVPKEGKVFTATTIPRGLLKEHTTKKGTWGIISIKAGKLEYKITSDPTNPLTFELSPSYHGIIEPQRLHQVRALSDDVEFVVEFLRLPGTGPVDEKREGL